MCMRETMCMVVVKLCVCVKLCQTMCICETMTNLVSIFSFFHVQLVHRSAEHVSSSVEKNQLNYTCNLCFSVFS
jgi:hypothetical protein